MQDIESRAAAVQQQITQLNARRVVTAAPGRPAPSKPFSCCSKI
ncbi:hypothetical protein [Polaromonas sp. CF318]|nr:hypothetical protein [Polaromonas sp. CF318]